MAKEQKHALYLVGPDDGARPELIHADDVEDRKAAGWKEPQGMKANGEAWNAEDDLAQQDIAADLAKAKAERDAEKAAEDAKEQAKRDAEAAKAAEAAPVQPDMKVQIVESPKTAAKKR